MRSRPRATRLCLLLSSAVLAAGLTAVPSAQADPTDPDDATPDTVESAQEEVDRLFREAEEASERFNELRVELRETRREVGAIEGDVASQEEVVEDLRSELGDMVAAQSQGGGLGPTTQLITSEDPDTLLSGLGAMEAYEDRQVEMLDVFETQQDELDLRLEQLQEHADSIADAKEQMGEEKAEIDVRSSAAEELLEELEAEEAAAIAEQEALALAAEEPDEVAPDASVDDAGEGDDAGEDQAPVDVPSGAPASGNAQAAIDFALAQVGDAYVYGAAGPDAWDCSGLTMGAWGAAGVSLPHSSGVQAGMGVGVSYEDLQPGDLVFYYSPISHVGMYIGNGQLVHAPNPSRSVEVVSVSSMPITTIRRVG